MYLARFLSKQARKSRQTMTKQMLRRVAIYNYKTMYTGKTDHADYVEEYRFNCDVKLASTQCQKYDLWKGEYDSLLLAGIAFFVLIFVLCWVRFRKPKSGSGTEDFHAL